MKNLLSLVYLIFIASCSTKEVEKPVEEPKTPEVKVPGELKPDPEKVVYLVFGDSGTGGKDQYALAPVMKKVCEERKCNAALHTGDIVYDTGIKSVTDPKIKTHIEKPYKDIDLTFWLSLGNHDEFMKNENNMVKWASKYNTKFRMLAEEYAVPKLPSWLRIWAINSDEMDSERAKKMESKLCGFNGWRVVLGHHPIFSGGQHGDGYTMKRKMLPVVEKCKIDLYLSGHEHDLQLLKKGKFVQVVSGAAAKLRPLKKKHEYNLFAKSTFGFVILTMTKDEYVLEYFDREAKILHTHKEKR